jgi:hypothetical protein
MEGRHARERERERERRRIGNLRASIAIGTEPR